MIKNILIYEWGGYNDSTVIYNLKALGYHCVSFRDTFTDYHKDAVFAQKMFQYIETQKIHMVFSWDYFPVLSFVCEIRRIPYVAWTYDCPCYSLMSRTILQDYNFFFCFDRKQAERLAGQGCKNVWHYPLAVDKTDFDRVIDSGHEAESKYAADISFVGRMYSEKEKWLETAGISEYEKGYLNGIAEAQLRVYGYNFVKEMIMEDMAEDIIEKADLKLGSMYFSDPVQMVADFVNEEVTRRERVNVLNTISRRHTVNLYSTSQYQGNEHIKICGRVDYQSEMPLVFHNSKINLNITSKTIESGISLRVLDILACGGFCLTNYQPEIAEYFEDGAELVMYSGMEDLENKVHYYLEHEKERKLIAEAGRRKVTEFFNLREKLSQMLAIVEENCTAG